MRLIEQRKENHDTILTMCSVAMQEQYRNGRHATLEHPWPSRAWNTRAMMCLEDMCYDVYVDQCMYGLVLPNRHGQEGPSKKPTCFRTMKLALANGLARQCDGQHVHVPIEGNAPGAKRRSTMAENYPEPRSWQSFCRQVFDDEGDRGEFRGGSTASC